MSLPLPITRSALRLCPASCSALKFASLSSRCCVSASRQFTCALRRQAEGKRKLVTATAYRPHTIDHLPTPPRNTDIPESSIATPAAVPAFHDIRPPKIQERQNEEVMIDEGEAQKSRPPLSIAETSKTKIESSTSSPKPTRPRLRPRKAAMTLTPSAASHLRALLSLPDPKMIRVGVKNRGCSGLAYHLEYVDKAGTFDETVEQDGVKVLIDSKALFSIIGSEMDWVEDKLSARFVFRNPNIKEECGCGESFMV